MPRKKGSESHKASSRKRKQADEEPELIEEIEGQFDEEAVRAIEEGIISSVKLDPERFSKRSRVREPDQEVEEKPKASAAPDVDAASSSSSSRKRREKVEDDAPESRFVGEPVPDEEARRRWPHRYRDKKQKQVTVSENLKEDESKEMMQARCHFIHAEVDGHVIFDLYDDAYVKAEDGEDNYICKIIEMFVGVDKTPYFTAQWFYRAKDTVMKDHGSLIDSKRVFFSEIKDDNPLDCLLDKLRIIKVDLEAKKDTVPDCDYYFDTHYLLPYSTFIKAPSDSGTSSDMSTVSNEVEKDAINNGKSNSVEDRQVEDHKPVVRLLDLYSGCGAMSTGLCLGASLSGLNLVTKWAVDFNKYACQSLQLNHPETEVWNEAAEDFLSLLKEWERLCMSFNFVKRNGQHPFVDPFANDEEEENSGSDDDTGKAEDDPEIFEVEKILAICFGDPNEKKDCKLHFKVRWKGYGPDEDTWEPLEGLGDCRERVKEFVTQGYSSKILPLPGDADVICGGPPCQGVSGFNRFRNKENPLADEKNKQLIVFMETVEYLKPKFVLMENVVDIIKFAGGYLGRYALARLVQLNYQARIGMMAAGSYGIPQFRMRVFLWGALSTEKLPQYPLPTHDVVVRGGTPVEFEKNAVAYEEGDLVDLEKRLYLEDAISDLPPVENREHRDEMSYDEGPKTEFQQLIRLSKEEMMGTMSQSQSEKKLYDHRPLELNTDDYQRSCQIPKKKGANFRDLPGVLVRPDNKVEWDPKVERHLLNSGKPLVPDYAMTFVNGTSSKPFARLWWDETVPTVVTRAEPHNQKILHPKQDRVLTIRENARLQGFPDYYRFCGPVKERYIQVGNAVAVPVARALGYALGLAFQGSATDEPLLKLPPKFPNLIENASSASSEDIRLYTTFESEHVLHKSIESVSFGMRSLSASTRASLDRSFDEEQST